MKLTPYQQAAFRSPCTTVRDFNRASRGPAESLGLPAERGGWAPVHHEERGYRVSMIVDAVPESAGIAEGWPAWHITVVLHGATSSRHRSERGKGHVERPLGGWGSLREKGALHIIHRELRGVGDPGSEVIVDKAGAMHQFRLEAYRAGAEGRPGTVQPPAGIYGRRRMTLEEAEICLRAQGQLGVLAQLDPKYIVTPVLPDDRARSGFDLAIEE